MSRQICESQSPSMIPFKSIQFFHLPSYSNVYCMKKFHKFGNVNRILVATLQRKIYCLEFNVCPMGDAILPACRELLFTYIPGEAEIISMDIVNSVTSINEFAIGIALVKDEEKFDRLYYLNIYSDWDSSPKVNLDSVGRSCITLSLDFVPYHLNHAKIRKKDLNFEVVWLLSGSDCVIHMFQEDKDIHQYFEINSTKYFSEFNNISSIVYWMDIKLYKDDTKRISGLGCENGFLRLTVSDVSMNCVLWSWESNVETPITSVLSFFLDTTIKNNNSFLEPKVKFVVTTSLGASAVVSYSDLMTNDSIKSLPESHLFDTVLCSCVGDFDMDGNNEIALGTFGQVILIYKCVNNESDEWELVYRQYLAYPVNSLMYLDLTGDGIKELIALTSKGVEVLQHDLDAVKCLLMKRTTCSKSFPP